MATRYGYRLYRVRVHRGRAHKPADFGDCEGRHYQDVLRDLLAALQTIAIGDPDLSSRADEESEEESGEGANHAGKRAFRVEHFSVTDRAIFGSLYSGRFGEYQLAMSASEDDEDASLEGLAASKSYRFALVLPEKGEYGVLGLETINLTCPVGQLTGWLSSASKTSSEREAVEKKAAGESSDTAPWWYFKARQMTDFEQLKELVETSQLSKVDLVQYDTSPDRIRRREKLRVTAPYIEGSAATSVANSVRAWWRQKEAVEEAAPDESVELSSDAEGANELKAIFGAEIENINFDDGWVVLKDSADRTKRISPSRMSELFTYTLSWDVPVADEAFYRRIKERAERLATNSNVDVEWPSPRKATS